MARATTIAPGVKLSVKGNLFTKEGMAAIVSAAAGVTRGEVRTIRGDIQKAWPRDTGAGQKSWRYKTTRRIKSVEASVYSTLPELLIHVGEEGRRPGKMPPSGALLGWMSRHGMDPKGEFALRRRIGRLGTSGSHAITRAMVAHNARQSAFLAQLAAKITEAANR